MFNIVLVEPEIPQNTGNIARTCAATGARLHLVKPLGFSLEDKFLKRAGLDYWQYLDVKTYENLDDFFFSAAPKRFFLYTTKGRTIHSDARFEDGDFLLFGKETKGLPESLLKENPEKCLRIPMLENLRSLNLSNCVAIAVYEALRQTGYEKFQTKGQLHESKWDE